MPKELKYAVGLDIAKDQFDACLAVIDENQKITVKSTKSGIANSSKGFDGLLEWTKKHLRDEVPLVFCMEATGIYYEQLAWFLHQQGQIISVLVPNKTRNYLKSLGIRTKNDKTDARGLATMACQQDLKPWHPLSNEIYELRQLTRYYEQLQNTRTMLRNQLQTMLCGRLENKDVAAGLKELLSSVETQIESTAGLIEKTVRKDPVLCRKIEDINSIKGLGLISIATVIAETDGFALFENIAQLVSYCGYDVTQNQSGKREGKTKISKMGNSRIRRILFLPAFSVVRYDIAPFNSLFNRVYDRTKIKMKAYVAVQRKLLILIYTLWRKNERFNYPLYPERGLGCSLSGKTPMHA